jgi:hypothetical protein
MEGEQKAEGVAHAMAQGDRIKGYRKMTEEELAIFNEGKQLGNLIGDFVGRLEHMPDTDKRWVAIGKTNLQQGIMAVLRGISRPESF